MERKRPRSNGSSDKLGLNVGGEIFFTSKSTLIANSAFFARKFSNEWSTEETADEELFLDRDADAFRLLLSCMRHRTALLPEHDKLLCTRVLLEAQYLGVDWLLQHVKSVAYKHLHPGLPELPEEPHEAFDAEHGSLEDALSSGCLPARFFRPERKGLKCESIRHPRRGSPCMHG